MIDIFKLAQTELDVLRVIDSDSANQTQLDLQKYIFHEIIFSNNDFDSNNIFFKKVIEVYNAVLAFNKVDNNNSSSKSDNLFVKNVIIYCDYSCFNENINCDKTSNKS